MRKEGGRVLIRMLNIWSLVLAGSEGGEAGVRDRRFRKLKTMTESQSAGYQVFLVISPRPFCKTLFHTESCLGPSPRIGVVGYRPFTRYVQRGSNRSACPARSLRNTSQPTAQVRHADYPLKWISAAKWAQWHS